MFFERALSPRVRIRHTAWHLAIRVLGLVCLLLTFGVGAALAAATGSTTTTTLTSAPTTTTTLLAPAPTMFGPLASENGCVVPTGANLVVSDFSNGVTPTDLASALVGSGVTVSNVTFRGQQISAGTFTDSGPVTGIASGIVLSSGCGKEVGGTNRADNKSFVLNTSGDSDLNTLIPGYTTYDATVLEFDFVPQSDTIQLHYVFASEEYNEYVNSSFNDVFGFFVNGVNKALLPDGTTTVAINNVNGGNPIGFQASNPTFYRNNDCSDSACALHIEADGLTVQLILTSSVLLNQTNHMKIAIADAGDRVLDSWIFLQTGSFRASENCTNGFDDDGDGFVDNADPDCWVCGDGNIDPGEECDDGNVEDGDGCSPLCKLTSTCGNNVKEGAETCDDGNTVSGDGCSSHCVLECLALGNCPTTTTTTPPPETGACCLPLHAGCQFVTEAECGNVDGSFTSVGTQCTDAGVCNACVNPVPNCDDNDPCTDDSCDQASGCVHTPNTAACSDGDPCTVDDTCSAGICAGAAKNCNDSNACTDDSCNGTGVCEHTNNTAACSDGNPCTLDDTCSAGTCAGTTKNCNDSDACTDDSCNTQTGICEYSDNTAACDDGNPCTIDDACNAGTCAGAAKNCDDSDACTDDSCNGTGVCEHTNNTAQCDDGNACTTGDVCSAGTCTGGSALDCNDSNPCTDDSCDQEAGCVNTSNTATCDDGNACTTEDACRNGACTGAAKDCNDSDSCTDDSCNTGTGTCEHSDNTAACDDGNACTTGDVCSAGTCTGGPAPNCDDEDICTDDSCDSASGCVNTNNTAACDDGNACTTADTCSDGACMGGPALDCDDSNPCTDDSCNRESGCVNANTTSACDDSNACTTEDTCADGVCVGGPPPDCEDNDLCTDDTCNPATGCENTYNTVPCDDGITCTVGDRCSSGTCVGNQVLIPAACKWVIVGGNRTRKVSARTRGGASVTGQVCGDSVQLGVDSTTVGDIVSVETSGNGIVLAGSANVVGNAITDGADVTATPRDTLLPGLAVETLPGGQTAHSSSGSLEYDTTGDSARADECSSAQGDIATSATLIASLPATQNLGTVTVKHDESLTIQATNLGGINVIDFERLLTGDRATITLDGGGNAATSFLVRVQRKLDLRLATHILLTGGADPARVIFFSQGGCRFGEEVVGGGTVLCPNAKLFLEERSVWNGSLMGGRGIVELRDRGTLIHVPLKLG